VLRPNSLTTRCGSPAYTAPEIINYKSYDERVDNWSLGVIVYCLLGGYPPFYCNTVKETFQQIRQGAYTFHAQYWNGISPDAKKFIKRLLTLDPVNRMTSREALQHSWMTGRGGDLGQANLANNIQRLKEYNRQCKRNSGPVKSVSFYWLISRR
jgi:calcium/calmodulin-dependent protein kinase I